MENTHPILTSNDISVTAIQASFYPVYQPTLIFMEKWQLVSWSIIFFSVTVSDYLAGFILFDKVLCVRLAFCVTDIQRLD